MAQLSISICRQLARARREKGMTQSALAEAVACKQSAISMLESGQPEKLSLETVAKIAALLEISLPSEPVAVSQSIQPLAHVAYCPSALCPSNIPYTVDGELLFWPQPQPGHRGTRCAACGEVLEWCCPTCGSAITPGACCQSCGTPRVTNTLPESTDVEAWVAQRRRELIEWRSLIR